MELAYVSSNKIYIEIEKKQQNFLAGVLKKITKRPSKFIATMLIGNNIALVVYGFFMGDILMQFIPIQGPSVLLVHTLLSTLLILLTAEFLPKVFFQIYANDLVKFFAAITQCSKAYLIILAPMRKALRRTCSSIGCG